MSEKSVGSTENAQNIFQKLKQESIQLHFHWIIYRQLFASSQANTALLNERGSNVFFLLQRLIFDNVSLSLSKFTDPPKQGRNSNLSIPLLIERVAEDSQSLSNELRNLFVKLQEKCTAFRLHRNKRIAHADYNHSLKIESDPLPGISRADVEDALSAFRDILNKVELHYFNSQTAYQMLVTAIGADGTALLRALRDAKKFREGDAQLGAQADSPAFGGPAA